MRVCLVAFGTQGDVQPLVALGLGLKRAGHSACILAPSNAEAYVRRAGLEFRSLFGDFGALLSRPGVRRHLIRSQSLATYFALAPDVSRGMPHMLDVLLDAFAHADIVIDKEGSAELGWTAAEATGAFLVRAELQPTVPTRAFGHSMWVHRSLPAALNRASYDIWYWPRLLAMKPFVDPLRRKLGLPPLTRPMTEYYARARTPHLHGYSESVVPRPSDWGPQHVLTGYWIHEQPRDARVPDDLSEWLDEGPPPIFFGFGSMPLSRPLEFGQLAHRMGKRFGRRVLIESRELGRHVRGRVADDVWVSGEFVPHELLLPRCEVAVHHGGPGTLAASLRAGIPAVVCSMWVDQHFWGSRVRTLGLGDHLLFGHLADRRLGRALEIALSPAVRDRAQAMRRRVLREAGVARAVEHLEQMYERRHRPVVIHGGASAKIVREAPPPTL